MASSLVKGVPYKIFICLKSVDLPDSPAPKIRSLILRDSAAQLWVSERESCGWGDCVDGGAVASMAWRVDGVTRARQWRGTSCEHAIAAARGGTRVGRGRACGFVGGAAARRARGRASSKDAVAYLAVALAPAAVVFRNRGAAAHVCATWMLFGSARARGRGFSLRDGCPLMSAACYSPRLLLRGLVTGRRQDAQGAAQAGAKHSGLFPTSAAATLSWEEVLRLLPRLERALTAPPPLQSS